MLFLTFIMLLIFAAAAWFERINSDAGYYLFQIIQNRWYYQEHGRFVLWFAEILPLSGIWLKLPLKTVIQLYSLNHVLFFMAGAWFCWQNTKNIIPPLFISLIAFCGLCESVFTPQFELYYGLVFLVCYYTLYEKYIQLKNMRFHQVAAMLFTLFFALTSHPMAVLLWLLLMLLENIQAGVFRRKWWFIALIILLIYSLIKKMGASDYEGGKIQWYWEHLQNTENWKIWRYFPGGWAILKSYYPDVLLFSGFILFQQLINKKWIFTAIYLAGIFFFLWLVWMVYFPENPPDRYLEQVYFPFVVAALLPLIFLKKPPIWLTIGFCFALFFRTYIIHQSWKHFSERTQTMDNLIHAAAKKGGQKFIIYPDDIGMEAYQKANWGYGFETLLRAVSEHHKAITITKDEDVYAQGQSATPNEREFLFTYWKRMSSGELNSDYFVFEKGVYQDLIRQKTALDSLK